jgi:hypothetical protein
MYGLPGFIVPGYHQPNQFSVVILVYLDARISPPVVRALRELATSHGKTSTGVLLLLEHHFLLIGSFSHSFFFLIFGFPNFSWLLPSLPFIVRSKFHPKFFHSSLPSTMTRPVGSINMHTLSTAKITVHSSCLQILIVVSQNSFSCLQILFIRHPRFPLSQV